MHPRQRELVRSFARIPGAEVGGKPQTFFRGVEAHGGSSKRVTLGGREEGMECLESRRQLAQPPTNEHRSHTYGANGLDVTEYRTLNEPGPNSNCQRELLRCGLRRRDRALIDRS